MQRLHVERLCVWVLIVLSVAAAGWAQGSRGSITGRVVDQQNAVIPSAAVTVKNVQTGVATKAVTNPTGYYEVNFLDPGTYSVSVEQPGFKGLIRGGIVLETGARLAIDLKLEIGQASQSVEVTAETPVIDTTSAGGDRVMDNREIAQLPYTTMNPFSLQALTPGVIFQGAPGIARVFDNAGTASYGGYGLVAGQGIIAGDEFLLDGAPVTGTNGGRAGFVPSAQAVGEMRVETSPFDASLGHTGGIFVSATTKGGTNTYHGSGFDQVQNYRWNATPFFTRENYKAGLANGTIKPGTPEQSSGKLSQPGFDIGGPVRIPKLFNGKNKLFFYFEYDNITNIQANPNTPIYTMPTAAERTGDFSALLSVPNASNYIIYDPRSGSTVNGHVTRTPFPGNIIPQSFIANNPIYKYYLQEYPMPNNPTGYVQPDGTNNFYDGDEPYNDYFNSIVNRYDYVATDKLRFNGKWYWNHRHQDAYDWGHATPLAGLQSNGLVRQNKGGSGDVLYTFNSNNVLDLGASVTRYGEGNVKPIISNGTAKEAGFPASYQDELSGYHALPAVLVNTYTVNNGGLTYPGLSQIGTTGQITAKMTTIWRSHTLKYGMDERRYWYAAPVPGGYPSGYFSFDNGFDKQADNTVSSQTTNIGLSWAAFEMGLPSTIQGSINDTGYYSTRYHSAYVQDDFRVTSKLRFGYGLRFEREGGISERFNRGIAGGFNSSYIPPYAQAVQAAYAANPLPQLPTITVAGGVNYLGKDYNNWTSGTNRFLPNFSVVYAWNPKTVVRAGYGWYSDTFNDFNSRPGQNGYSQTTTTQVSSDNGLTFCCGVGANSNLTNTTPILNPFPTLAGGTHLVQPFGAAFGPDTLDGQGYTYYPRSYAPAINQRWKLSVQRELFPNQVLDVSYNGSYSTYPFTESQSYLPVQYWATGNTYNATEQAAMTATVNNPFYIGNLTALQQSNPNLYNYLNTISWFTSKTLQTQQLLRANLNSGAGLSEANAVRAKSWYHDAEFLYTKRFSHGILSSFSYTRSFGRQQWQPNNFNQTPSWELNPNIRPNRLVWNAVWELPFGRGRQWLTSGPLQHVVGGWQLSWVYQYQTGAPVNWGNLFYYGSVDQVVQALNESATHAANSRQEYSTAAVYSPVFNSSDSASAPIPSGFVGFEGRSAFQPGSYQTRQFPQYVNGLRIDPIRNWDVKIYRRFRLHERLNMNFGIDALNLANHTQFGQPVISPTATNFGAVTSQANGARQLQMNLRIEF
ncbi:MAG TPA: carboxypeptidase regulatory-like domain-containing protein [Bryobacteraceae bacterium]